MASSSMADAFRVSDADLLVYVHPSNANSIQQALSRQLSVALFSFNETFDGILLAYSLRIPERMAKILPGLIPYLCVKVKATLLLFTPRQDMILEGKVVKLSKESIYVVVLGFCAAAIGVEDIRPEFRYRIKSGNGIFSSNSHQEHIIKLGSMLRFLVKSFDEEILHISGSLMPDHTGCIGWLSKQDSEIDRSQTTERSNEVEVKSEKIKNEEQKIAPPQSNEVEVKRKKIKNEEHKIASPQSNEVKVKREKMKNEERKIASPQSNEVKVKREKIKNEEQMIASPQSNEVEVKREKIKNEEHKITSPQSNEVKVKREKMKNEERKIASPQSKEVKVKREKMKIEERKIASPRSKSRRTI